jgi:hypothetical protein
VACLEFAPNAGWWGVFAVNDGEEIWEKRVKLAFRYLADSGFGGERSRGWGRAATPEFSDASSLMRMNANEEGAWWLLSLYSPHDSDAVDWSRGEFTSSRRGGWTDSQAGVAAKKQVQFVDEGSVVFAPSLSGRAVDVGPEGFPHPVYRSGFALAIPAPAEPVMRPAQTPKVAAPPLEPAAPEAPSVQETELPPSEVEEILEAEAVMENEGGLPEESEVSETLAAETPAPEAVAPPETIIEPETAEEKEEIVEAEAVMESEGGHAESPDPSSEEQS